MNAYLLDIDFLEVIWFMLIIFFWSMILWVFIATIADIFRRDDLSGLSKALWCVGLIFLPLLGVLIYMIMRPAVTPSDIRMAEQAKRMMGSSSAEEIAKANELLKSGAINQQEFDEIKRKALA